MFNPSENFRQAVLCHESAPKAWKVSGQAKRALAWLAGFGLIGIALILLYHDAEQQDSAYHFLFARWAWRHPAYFVSVWARPLFTLVYFLPSQLGYSAAKLFTVIIGLTTGWHTYRLATQIGFRRAELAVPLLFLQPAFFALSSVVMTETLFALVFVVGLRLHLSGRIKAGMLVASSLILIRPEGFFLGLLWGMWVLRIADCGLRIEFSPKTVAARSGPKGVLTIRNPQSAIRILFLASGMFVWWLAAYWLTGDGLWIIHNWPSDWQMSGQANGTGPIWWYAAQLPLIAGLPLFVPFLVGFVRLVRAREFICGTTAFLTLFIAHSVMFTRGWFGSAGYARYFVCVSPVIAVIALEGWNELVEGQRRFFNLSKRPVAIAILTVSALSCFVYVDAIRFTRDARAIEWMHSWLRFHQAWLLDSNSEQISRLICSQAYTRILLDRDPWEKPAFSADRAANMELLHQSPAGTLALWDEETGPKWYRLRAEDFEAAGYERLKSQEFTLEGWFVRLNWDHLGGPRRQHMYWFYKPANGSSTAGNQLPPQPKS